MSVKIPRLERALDLAHDEMRKLRTEVAELRYCRDAWEWLEVECVPLERIYSPDGDGYMWACGDDIARTPIDAVRKAMKKEPRDE